MNGIVKALAPLMAFGAVAAALASPALAQTKPDRAINARLHRQDRRIDRGVKNHDLNKFQAKRLDALDRGIHRTEMRDRRHDDGRLTSAERTRLQHRLNRVSDGINDKKHGKP